MGLMNKALVTTIKFDKGNKRIIEAIILAYKNNRLDVLDSMEIEMDVKGFETLVNLGYYVKIKRKTKSRRKENPGVRIEKNERREGF